MKMINEKEKEMKEKIDFYKDKDIKIHVKLNNKRFLNGKIVLEEAEKIYIFDDDKMGNIHLFINDIYDIEEYKQEVRG